MNFNKEASNGNYQNPSQTLTHRIKKIKIGEQFKDCFKFTLKMKDIKSKLNTIDDKILNKVNKSDKLPNNYIKQLCNMLKTRDLFYSKKRNFINSGKTYTLNPSRENFQTMSVKDLIMGKKRPINEKSVYSYNVLKITKSTALTSLVESDLDKWVTSPSLEEDNEIYKVNQNVYSPRVVDEKLDNNLLFNNKMPIKIGSFAKPQLSSRENFTRSDKMDSIKAESFINYTPIKSKSKCQLFKESDNILSRIDFIDNRRNKILNDIIKKNTKNTIKTKKTKYVKANE